MNAKSLLIAAAVLATPACAVSEDEVSKASEDAVSARVSLQGETYLSRDTFTIVQYRRRPDGTDVREELQVRYRLRFIPASVDSYSYDGEGAMEYETVIDQVQTSKPELAFSPDRSFYAKRTDGNSFRLFDCDSTSRCADGKNVSKLDTFMLDGKKTLKLSGLSVHASQDGVYLEGVNAREILFVPTTAAPEHVDLPSEITCEANGKTLSITHASGSLATVELRDRGAVLESDRYNSVLKDALGHYFVVAPWNGVRISLGDHAARYENEVSGVTVEFASGTCSATP